MDKNYFINLTQKLYRLTFFFPEREPLRYKIREMADQILSNLVLILEGKIEERMDSSFDVEKNIEMLDALLELAKTQLWVGKEEIEKVQDNYAVIKREIEEFNEILRKKMALREEKKLLTEKAERIEEERKKYQEQLRLQEEQGMHYSRKYYEVPTDTLKTKAQEEVLKMKEERQVLEQERALQEKEMQRITEELPVKEKVQQAPREEIVDTHSKEQQNVPEIRSKEHKMAVMQAIQSAKSVNNGNNGGREQLPTRDYIAPQASTSTGEVKLNKRQQKIVDLLGKRDKMQVKDFQEFLPTTKRTLRRDLLSLVESNVIKRTGRGNVTYYSK